MGNGSSISVWRDPWLSLSQPVTPIGPPTSSNGDLRVRDLISTVTHDWDVPAIRAHLPQYEEIIRSLVPSQLAMEDSLQWLPEKKGIYTTRSEYALAKLNASGPPPTPFSWKRNIWNLQCSPKLNLFLWKAASKALPVGAALARRGMDATTCCKRCGEVESEIHVLLQCPFAAKVWELSPILFNPPPTDSTTTTVHQLLHDCIKAVNLPPTGLSTPLYPWILWNLWT